MDRISLPHKEYIALVATIARLEAEKARLIEILRDLYDEQNGAPNERRRTQWLAAYHAAAQLLKELESNA